MTRDHLVSRVFASDLIRLNTYLLKFTLTEYEREQILDQIKYHKAEYKFSDGSTLKYLHHSRKFMLCVLP